jgi:APA family basic amino acid/polyamine antiporter
LIAAGTAIVAVLYVGLNLIFIYALPLEAMKGKTAIGAPAAAALFGPNIAGPF